MDQLDSRPAYPQSSSSVTGPLNHSNASSVNPNYKLSRQMDEASNQSSTLPVKPGNYTTGQQKPGQGQQQPPAPGKYNGSAAAPGSSASGQRSSVLSENGSGGQAPAAKPVNIRNYEEMKKWAIDLSYRGAK